MPRMTLKKNLFDCHFKRFTSGDYEIVEMYEQLPNGDRWQLSKYDRELGTFSSAKHAKEFAEEYERTN